MAPFERGIAKPNVDNSVAHTYSGTKEPKCQRPGNAKGNNHEQQEQGNRANNEWSPFRLSIGNYSHRSDTSQND
jgi:hypothetical protein